MMTRERNETGDTLVEILISLVIIGLVVGAYFATITTTTTAASSHRDLVTADAVLRDSAELTKSKVRHDCSTQSTYDVDYSGLGNTNVSPPASVFNQPCPPTKDSIAAQVPVVNLTVTLPHGRTKSLDIMVRTP
jgi:type II secretory pathway pseudopilin PulG